MSTHRSGTSHGRARGSWPYVALLLGTLISCAFNGPWTVSKRLSDRLVWNASYASLPPEVPANRKEPSVHNLSLFKSISSRNRVPPCESTAGCERPESFRRCGDWQEEYMALHRQILAAERPPRYLIAVLPHYGLADQLVGIITLFYWAFLTGRAFQISTGGQPLPPLEAAFDAPFVNWTRPAGDPPVLTEHLHLKYKGEMRYPAMHPAVPNLSEYGSMRLINGFYDFLSTENLSTIPEVEDNKSVLFMTSNRGCTQRIFNNPHYSQKLYDVGLRPETAFACAFRFLFAPSQVTRSAPGWQLAKSRLHPPPNANDSMTEGQDPSSKPENVLRIGIQIRVGDRVYRSHTDDVQFEDYMPYFDCARTIERHKRTSETTKVVWYLVSDSQRLKEKALERFGPDLLVTSTQPNTHVAHTQPKDLEEADKIMTGLGSAAADMLGLAESDYFVVTQNSGFGRIGALLSGRWNHIWSLSSESNERLMCRPADYVRLEDMASTWSGV